MVLILTSAMGAGHDQAAAELARRLRREGVEATIVDVLDLLPLRLGAGLRRSYARMIHSIPWLYAAIYRVFFRPRHAPPPAPLANLIAARLAGMVSDDPPEAVVATFHLAGQAAGVLRVSGRLRAPLLTVVTDFAVHRMWLHPGIDEYLCPDGTTAETVRHATGRPATVCAPLVRPEFFTAGRSRGSLTVPSERPRKGEPRVVIISAGAWGAGDLEATARLLAESGRYHPLVLCGRNTRLLGRLRRMAGCSALGWSEGVADLMTGAYALVDNAAGLTCREAAAVGLPVISFRPIPGHGREGVEAMARAGFSVFARSGAGLLRALDDLSDDTCRHDRIRRARRLFDAAPAEREVMRVLHRVSPVVG